MRLTAFLLMTVLLTAFSTSHVFAQIITGEYYAPTLEPTLAPPLVAEPALDFPTTPEPTLSPVFSLAPPETNEPVYVLEPGMTVEPVYAPGPVTTYEPANPAYARDHDPYEDVMGRLYVLENEMRRKQDKTVTRNTFTANVGGRVFLDTVNFSGPHTKWGGTPYQSNILGLREARIDVSGEGYGIFDYKVELGYDDVPRGNNGIRLKDVYMGAKNVPWLNYVRIGHFKVESGMSYTASSNNTTAMERTTAVQVFSPERRFGIGQTYFFAEDRVRWFNGLFAAQRMDGIKYHTADHQGAIFNSRLTFLPYCSHDGEDYLHFGGHYLYYDLAGGRNYNNAPGMASIGGFRAANNWYDITAVNASNYNQGGLEMAWGCGPWGISSELFGGTFGNGRSMYGGYIEARWFLTGDSRAYDKKIGAPGHVKTRRNFNTAKECVSTSRGYAEVNTARSWGAWELYTQWGFTDADRVYFNDNGLFRAGGRTVDLSVGLNWYLNPNTRMMFEYVHSDGTSQGRYRASADIYSASLRFFF